eukprot:CAMPEP_0196152338 /NCGR_PEP_ID=MMETSP0910-20130528/35320_1 /TAXON_ID=49265 /ORGANISM="Thalassiosira rotula, Strain GSO102" /LENGTH=183 /DNA_ID=CAMNT_0041415911 /DNA_START=62 /DNA_END=612 /DNA_ORIENTATION=+
MVSPCSASSSPAKKALLTAAPMASTSLPSGTMRMVSPYAPPLDIVLKKRSLSSSSSLAAHQSSGEAPSQARATLARQRATTASYIAAGGDDSIGNILEVHEEGVTNTFHNGSVVLFCDGSQFSPNGADLGENDRGSQPTSQTAETSEVDGERSPGRYVLILELRHSVTIGEVLPFSEIRFVDV